MHLTELVFTLFFSFLYFHSHPPSLPQGARTGACVLCVPVLQLQHQPAVELRGVLLPLPAPSSGLHVGSAQLPGQDPSPQLLQRDADHCLHHHSRHAGGCHFHPTHISHNREGTASDCSSHLLYNNKGK